MTDHDDTTISAELAAKLADLDPIDTTIDPALATAINEVRTALGDLTGEARRTAALRLRFAGPGHPLSAVADLPADDTDT